MATLLFVSLQVYHAFYKPLEFTVAERDAGQCYLKVGSSCCPLKYIKNATHSFVFVVCLATGFL